MKIYKSIIILNIFLLILGATSCKKYLAEKSIRNETLPENLRDLQALLDNYGSMNASTPGLAEMVADNYFVTTTSWQSLGAFSPDQSLNYIWSTNAIPYDDSWNLVYKNPIYYSNIVLDHLPNITVTRENKVQYNSIKGSALFYRAFAFYSLTQLYCKPYSSSASIDLGIVLRMTSDINQKSVRASVRESYERIISDMENAAELLPISSALPTRPTKAAAFAALSRIYLSIREYQKAQMSADASLELKNTLLNYNNLGSSGSVERFNQEVIYHSVAKNVGILRNDAKIDSNLYRAYASDDLRKKIFFDENQGVDIGTYFFKGSYDGQEGRSSVFDGLTTAELYLTRAECYARAGNVTAAMNDLNLLLKNRWKSNNWVPFVASNAVDAKRIILEERRKELIFRGQRWSDLRRINLEGANISLTRIIDGVTYTLPPNDPKWVMLIPYDVINLSGIAQNIR